MTWDELRGALRTAGLHRIDEGVAAGTGALFVTGLAWDSRAVEPGNVFIALKGLRADGNLFATQAVSRGAVAIVSEQPPPANFDVPWVTVPDARLALALLAITF